MQKPKLWERIRKIELQMQKLSMDLGQIMKEVKAGQDQNDKK